MNNSSNVWGSGGLFEQALASKMGLQSSESVRNFASADTLRQNANSTEADVANRYDLGLRGVGVDQMNADTNRLNAGVNQANANTSAFAADTDRLVGFNRFGRAAPDSSLISSLNLRSVNPYEPAPKSSATIMSSTPTMLARPDNSPLAPSSAGMSAPQNRRFGVGEQYGLKNGGLVMKPKMVQPGYMHGGKITPPKGYKKGGMVGCADGGKIGDIKKDTGRDKVPVMAREGEYMLNPETVAHVGGGDYERGVRNLNQLVRQATGKEPGPTPVGKSGKLGFENSGELPRNRAVVPVYDASRGPGPNGFGPVDEAAIRAEQMRYPAIRPGPNASGYNYVPNWTVPDPRYNYDGPRMGPNEGPQLRERFTRFNNPDVGASIRAGVQGGVNAVKNAAPTIMRVADSGLRKAGRVATPLAAIADTADVVDVATDPNMAGRDVAGEAAGKAAKWAAGTAGALQGGAYGAAIGGPAAPITGTLGAILGGAAGYFGTDQLIKGGRALRGVDTRDPSEYSQGVVSDMLGRNRQGEAAPAAAPVNPENKASSPSEQTTSEQPGPAVQEPGLREMMLKRYKALNDGLKGADAMTTIVNLNQMDQLHQPLTELENAEIGRQGTLARLMMDRQNNADERIQKDLFTFPTFDKEGKRTGTAPNTEMANDFRKFLATNGLSDQFYNSSKAEQDDLARQFTTMWQTNRNFNDTLRSGGGNRVRVTNSPNALLIKQGIGLGDAMKYKGVTGGQYLRSLNPWSDATDNQLAIDPTTGEAVPLYDAIQSPEGGVDMNQLNAIRSQDQSLRNMIQSLRQKK